MKRLLVICTAAMLALVPVSALAQAKPDAKAAQSKSKSLTATGTVSAVSADSLTVKTATGDLTFSVDSKTSVVGKGMGTKEAALKKDGKATSITEFVKTGDGVTVTYHETGTTKHASTVRVVPAKPAK